MLVTISVQFPRTAPVSAPDPFGSLDFVNGVYTLDGVSLTAADVVAHPEYIVAQGLQDTDFPTYADGNSVDIIGDFRDAMLSGERTVLVEYEELTSSGQSIPLSIQNGALTHVWQLTRNNSAGDNALIYDKTADPQRDINTQFTDPVISGLVQGIHKFAVTRTTARLRASINGSAVLVPVFGTDTSQAGFTATTVSVGGFSADAASNDLYLRKLQIWEPLDDEFLPILSA